MTFEDTTINAWAAQTGTIHLRKSDRPRAKRLPRDLDAARGVILSAAIGAALWSWGYVFIWWLAR